MDRLYEKYKFTQPQKVLQKDLSDRLRRSSGPVRFQFRYIYTIDQVRFVTEYRMTQTVIYWVIWQHVHKRGQVY